MAGAGWKDFVPGEVLSAANVQDYLQDQSVMVFASAAARTSALASPSEGMVSYLKDTDTVERFDGSSWVVPFSVANGGTGATTVAGAITNLNIGILQVVSATVTVAATTTSTSWVDGGLSASITPKFTTSKILVLVSQEMEISTSGPAVFATVFRGTTSGTNLGDNLSGLASVYSQSGGDILTPGHVSVVDSPTTTSSLTYSTAFRVSGSTGRLGYTNQRRTITLIEVAA